jgi:hypothetical protein
MTTLNPHHGQAIALLLVYDSILAELEKSVQDAEQKKVA